MASFQEGILGTLFGPAGDHAGSVVLGRLVGLKPQYRAGRPLASVWVAYDYFTRAILTRRSPGAPGFQPDIVRLESLTYEGRQRLILAGMTYKIAAGTALVG